MYSYCITGAGLLLAVFFSYSSVQAQETPLEELVVEGRRLPAAQDAGFAVEALDRQALRETPSTRLDDILRALPDFALFRRTSSLSAHPTIQGPTLRVPGPSGAARALVLLDGIPLNDPFGGWVYWSFLAPETLERANLDIGGGAGRWGSGALTGTVHLTSRDLVQGAEVRARAGDRATADLFGRAGFASERLGLEASGLYYESDGFIALRKQDRGPVDIAQAQEAGAARLRAVTETERSRFELAGDFFSENRVNGLDESRNATDGWSIALFGKGQWSDRLAWDFAAYHQDRDFENVFAAVDDERASARPVLDQFSVPGEGTGAQAGLRYIRGILTLEAGADLRHESGTTNERFRNLGAGFTRERRAGGERFLAGAYVRGQAVALDTEVSAGLRLDYWSLTDGSRQEQNLETGETILTLDFNDREDVRVNGWLGAARSLGGGFGLEAGLSSSYRVPTINELYRPFRVGNDITEANAGLAPERLLSAEAALTYAQGPWQGDLRYGRSSMRDGIGNVTVAFGPGVFPVAGFVPPGGSLRERQNIGRIAIHTLRADLAYDAGGVFAGRVSYLFADTEMRKAPNPDLTGKDLAQAPRHRLVLSGLVRPAGGLTVSGSLRYVSDAFEDDLNQRVLEDFVTVDLRAAYALTDHVSLFVAAENLFDEFVPVAVSGDGLVDRGTPRLVSAGFRAGF